MRNPLPRLVLGALLALGGFLGLPEVCLACACSLRTPAQARDEADVVFRGRLVETYKDSVQRYRFDGTVERVTVDLARFRVDTVWKGPLLPEVVLFTTAETDCHVRFVYAQGMDFLVYAHRGGLRRDYPDWLHTSNCAGTRLADSAGEYLAHLGAGASPLPLSQDGLARKVVLAALDLAPTQESADRTRGPMAGPGRVPRVVAEFGFIPVAIATDRQGNLYVSDTAERPDRQRRIAKFSPAGQLLAQWNSPTTGLLAVDPLGNVYLASPYSIYRFSPTGQLLAQFGSRGGAPGQFDYVTGLATDDQGNLYVADALNDRLQKLSATGDPLAQWGTRGSGSGQFIGLAGVALDRDGNLYVVESGNHRVQKLSPAGEPLAQWGTQGGRPGQPEEPRGIAVDGQDNVYVADLGSNRVRQYSPTGQLLAEWGGLFGSAPGHFRRPYGIAADREGAIYVIDPLNYRIQQIPPAARR